MGTEGGGNLSCEVIGAMVTAEQRHDGGAVLSDGEHRWFRVFVGENRREEADHSAGGHHGNNRSAGGKQRLDMILGRCKAQICLLDPGGSTMQFAADVRRNAATQRSGGLTQNNDGRFGRGCRADRHHTALPSVLASAGCQRSLPL